MKFNFTTLLPPLCLVWIKRSFQLHPINPHRWWVAIAVLNLELVVLIPLHLEVSVIGLFLLNGELFGYIRSNFEGDFYKFWILDCSCNLMAADSPTFQTPVPTLNFTLGMTNLDKPPRCGCSFNHTNTNPHDIVTRRHFLGLHNYPSSSVRQL